MFFRNHNSKWRNWLSQKTVTNVSSSAVIFYIERKKAHDQKNQKCRTG
ncbi:hypothetical protein GHH_c17140 [Geobacillus sp. GHH01]|nr:hypothetical protein GHH_c17140 [Geobacillus sp. GHH01]